MDHPTILYEAAKMRQAEIKKEMASWRLAHQSKTTKPGLMVRFAMAGLALLKKAGLQQKQESHSSDENLILNTNP